MVIVNKSPKRKFEKLVKLSRAALRKKKLYTSLAVDRTRSDNFLPSMSIGCVEVHPTSRLARGRSTDQSGSDTGERHGAHEG